MPGLGEVNAMITKPALIWTVLLAACSCSRPELNVEDASSSPKISGEPSANEFPYSDEDLWRALRTGWEAKADSNALARSPDEPEKVKILMKIGRSCDG